MPADLHRVASFNTKVHVLRTQSPFYRQQLQSPPAQQQQAAEAPGIELKPASANVLLGLQHLENRGKFVAAHPVHHPGSVNAVRRGASPQTQQHLDGG